MIYFSKTLTANVCRHRQSLTAHAPILGLATSLHRDSAWLRDWAREKDKHENALNDLVAAILFNLFREEVLKRAQFTTNLLRLSRDLLSDKGYEELLDSEILQETGNDNELNLALVAGCQSEDQLGSRVRAAFKLCVELLNGRRHVEIVFSGSSPGGTARIRDESRRMRLIFDDLLKREAANLDPNKLMHIDVLKEGEARRTEENVKYFMKMKRDQLTRVRNLFVVSSTYHVPRVCQLVEDELALTPQNGWQHTVSRIIAVGAEPLDGNVVSSTPGYTKSMAFECVRELLRRDEFWPVLDDSHKQRVDGNVSSPVK